MKYKPGTEIYYYGTRCKIDRIKERISDDEEMYMLELLDEKDWGKYNKDTKYDVYFPATSYQIDHSNNIGGDTQAFLD